MALNWSFKKLTDSELLKQLQDLGGDVSFTRVYLSNNELHHLPDFNSYKQFQNLERLSLSGNSITQIDPSKLPPHLTHLDISDNGISELCGLTDHKKLVELNVSKNKLKAIYPSQIPEYIQELDIASNEITKLCDLSQLEKLAQLYVSSNKLNTIDPSQLPVNLQELDIANNEICELCDISGHKKLKALDVSYNKLKVIDPSKVPVSIQDFDMAGNEISELCDMSAHSNIIELYVSHNKLTKIDWSKVPVTIEELDVAENEIRELCGLTGHQELVKLNLQENKLNEIDPSRLPINIQEMNMADNKTSELCDLSEHRKLVKLKVSRNRITRIDPSKIPVNIRELHMEQNQIKELCDLSKHKKLIKLDVSHNTLTHMDPSEIPINIQTLIIEYNEISELCDLSRHKKLSELNVSWNKVTAIDQSKLPVSLQELDLAGNEITELPDLSNHTNLRNLKVSYNKLIFNDQAKVPDSTQELQIQGNKLSEFGDASVHKKVVKQDVSSEKVAPIHPSKVPINMQEPTRVNTFGMWSFQDEGDKYWLESEMFFWFLVELVKCTPREKQASILDSIQGKPTFESYGLPARTEYVSEKKPDVDTTPGKYEISSKCDLFHFPDNEVTVEIPPNSLPAHLTSCMASVSPKKWQGPPQKHALSKIYEFSPSGLTTQNKLMFVIPLFDSHHYDYDNMTLMYRQDRHSQFVDADELKVHKPTWLFYGNECFVFLDHFCEGQISEKKLASGGRVKFITLESFLFFKQTDNILELVTTFGCYERTSICSCEKVIQSFKESNYKLADQRPVRISEDGSFTVEPKFSTLDWIPKYPDDGREEIPCSLLFDICTRTTHVPVHFTHEFFQHQTMSEEKKNILIRLAAKDLLIRLCCHVSELSSYDIRAEAEGPTWLQGDVYVKLTKVFYQHMTPEHMDCCAKIMNVKLQSDMDPREFSRFFLHQYVKRYHGAHNLVQFLQSLIIYLEGYPCLKRLLPNLEKLKHERMREIETGEAVVEVYVRTQNELQILCQKCQLAVAKKTLAVKDVITTLSKVGKSFTSSLSYNIITSESWEKINKSETGAEASGHIRIALHNSSDPDLLDDILKALNETGEEIHANEIQKHYHEQINNYQQCPDCRAQERQRQTSWFDSDSSVRTASKRPHKTSTRSRSQEGSRPHDRSQDESKEKRQKTIEDV